ncbi:hypothetical protein QTI53_13415 [Clostridium perfringens]|nr:hypothetical protein [Clostridium perfringens]
MDLFNVDKKIKEKKLHPKFKFLRDTVTLDGERNVLNDWIDGMVDRDGKIVKEFQTTFHSSLWEFFLFSFFKEANLTLNQRHNRPDFIIEKPYKINIEAVTANIKSNGKNEKNRGINDILSMLTPIKLQDDFNELIDEAITRYSNAIISKNIKFINEYSNLEHLDKDAPFIIALASYDQINYGREFIYPMLALLYGLYYDNKYNVYKKRESILKPGSNAEIPINLFAKDEYRNISAVIFSCTVTLGKLTSLAISKNKSKFNTNTILNIRRDYEDDKAPYKLQKVSNSNPELLSDGIFIFHNPNANNSLLTEVFESTNATQFWLKDNKLIHTSNTYPIVSRINFPSIFENEFIIMAQESIRNYNNISLEEFYYD